MLLNPKKEYENKMELDIIQNEVKIRAGLKRDKRLVRTKKAIVFSLMELMKTKELDRITVTELTNRADVNRKTFYLHYECVADVLEDFADDLVYYLGEVMKRSRSESGEISFDDFFAIVSATIEQNLDFFRAFSRSEAYNAINSEKKKDMTASLHRALFGYFKDGDLSSRYKLEFILSGVLGLYNSWLFDEAPILSAAEIGVCAATMCKRALGSYGGDRA